MGEPPVHVTTDEVHAHPHSTGRPKLDLVIAVSAIFISAISLFVAVEHGKTERDLVRSNAWPFLREVVDNEYNEGRDVAIGVSNGGVGPAKLESLQIAYDGQPVASPLDLLRRCCGLGDASVVSKQLPKGLFTSVADETVLRPGEENVVMLVHRLAAAPDVPDRFASMSVLLKLRFQACYCSILNECWLSDLRSTRVKDVARCKPPEHPFDPNGS